MHTEPYLFFNGRCEEAIALYRSVFNSAPAELMRYQDSPEPPPMPLPPDWGAKIMHGAFKIGDTLVMASDGCSDDAMPFAGFALSVTLSTPDEAALAFKKLAEGGEIRMPLGATFFSPCFGMVADRFGICWMLIVAA